MKKRHLPGDRNLYTLCGHRCTHFEFIKMKRNRLEFITCSRCIEMNKKLRRPKL